ncbi:hypothetical protein TWF173_002074, partial [Orbilia oligospora]
MSYRCTGCRLEFPIQSKLSEHRRSVHQTEVKVTFGNGEQVKLVRVGGEFRCPVCEIPYKNPNNLRGHVKTHPTPTSNPQ